MYLKECKYCGRIQEDPWKGNCVRCGSFNLKNIPRTNENLDKKEKQSKEKF